MPEVGEYLVFIHDSGAWQLIYVTPSVSKAEEEAEQYRELGIPVIVSETVLVANWKDGWS